MKNINITMINCEITITVIGETGMNSTTNINNEEKEQEKQKPKIQRKEMTQPIRRIVEILEASKYGSMTMGELICQMNMVKNAAIDSIAKARDMGIITLKNGKYELAN